MSAERAGIREAIICIFSTIRFCGVQWNNMSWGHAVSSDLLHWQQLEEALLPEADGPAFTGSAVLHKGELPEVSGGRAGGLLYLCLGTAAYGAAERRCARKPRGARM